MAKKIAYGMVGGAWDAFIGDVHRKAIAFDPRAELVAGCFSQQAERNQKTGDIYALDTDRVYATYQEMAEKESRRPDGITFVSITTPNNAHYQAVKCFLSHGIHVVCEKPLCFSPAEATELVALAQQHGLLFAVNYSYSGFTMVKLMKEMIQAGKIGEVLNVNAEYAQDWLLDMIGSGPAVNSKIAGWRSDPKVAGISNCVGDIGSHIEHTVSYLTGLHIKRLLATTDAFGKALDMNANMIVEYDNGARGAYWCSQVACGNLNGLAVRIYGTQGSLEWQQHTPDYVRFTPKGCPPQILSRGTGYISETAAATNRLPSGHPEGLYVGFANIYRNFINAVAKRQEGLPLTPTDLDFPDVRDGLRGVQFIHAVIDSAAHNAQWVDVDA